MNDLTTYKNFFFIGIGGIGMSALAQYFNSKSVNVCGYDRTNSEQTKQLIDLGITIIFKDNLNSKLIQQLNKSDTIIIYTPAISDNSNLLNFFITNQFNCVKRSVILGQISNTMTTLAIAGTHGKTTTTAILAHLLLHNNYPVSVFCGGVMENYQSNYLSKGDQICVVEADEYDRSFLHLAPDLLAITSIDLDHMDIYESKDDFYKTFNQFASKVTAEKRVVNNDIKIGGQTIAFNQPDATWNISNIKVNNANQSFDLDSPYGFFNKISFNLPGKHNIQNAVTAMAMAMNFGLSIHQITSALSSFKGIARRFSYQINSDSCVYIDDYAHHPTEILAVYQAVKSFYPNKHVTVIFQPHLYSRTNDFMDEFAHVLSLFDRIFLLDIYPARELPIEGVNSKALLKKITKQEKKLVSKKELTNSLSDHNIEIILTLGAGDIGNMVEDITNLLKQRIIY